MKESDFQKALTARLKKVGALVFNVHGHGFQEAGWPDLQVYHWVWTGHLELKVNHKVSTLQRIKIRELKKRGASAFVLRCDGSNVFVENNSKQWPMDGIEILEWLRHLKNLL